MTSTILIVVVSVVAFSYGCTALDRLIAVPKKKVATDLSGSHTEAPTDDETFIEAMIGLLKVDPSATDQIKRFKEWEYYFQQLKEKHGTVSTGLLYALEKYLAK